MGRSKSLDILRAVAVILVLGRHMIPCPEDLNPTLHFLTTIWLRVGWVGVDLFFVLSGFLISGLLFREYKAYGQIAFKHFFIRRGFKIYPPFFVLIMLTVFSLSLRGETIPYINAIHEIFFLQNYQPGLWNHTWSLAVEEHFYILLPALFVFLLRHKESDHLPFRKIPYIFIFIAFICLFLRIYTSFALPYRNDTHLFPTHLRVDSLFSGVVISYFYHYHYSRFYQITNYYGKYIFLLGLFCFIPAFIFELENTPFIYTFGFSIFWVGSGLILVSVVNKMPNANVLTQSLSLLGIHSYSIYLWHMPVSVLWKLLFPIANNWLDSKSSLNWYFYSVWYLFGSILLGILMTTIMERPILRLRDYMYPSRSQQFTQNL